jgi:Raf kinase inhibitor-like YbhB/YbcL family protein
MNKFIYLILTFLIFLFSCKSEKSTLKLEVVSFPDGGFIPDKYALCIPDENGKFDFGENINPHVRWSGVPPKTKSLALFLVDLDFPKKLGKVNVATITIPEDEPRTGFYHWVIVDIPLTTNEIPEAVDSKGVVKGGKPISRTPYGFRGLNDYSKWFRGDVTMAGQYAGYDGPCPPWNDEKVHRYAFRIYALDVAQLGLRGRFSPEDALKAMEGHIIAKAEWAGKYTANSKLRKNLSIYSHSTSESR